MIEWFWYFGFRSYWPNSNITWGEILYAGFPIRRAGPRPKPETSTRFFCRRKHKVENRIAYSRLVNSTYYYLLTLQNDYKESYFKRNFTKIIKTLIIMLFLVFSRSQSKLNIHVIARFVRTFIREKYFIVYNLFISVF